eukprot:TRINITY_DN93841_c0_g1_i1.p1 TRINITY_DN93841_c0_g1~~TRINITY_DN93841_c0_g1_i1.p1  ORF type:complete len:204 (+),score=50.16 TRINITY_DN93841_c0_g1_i1:84-695(+)
MGVTKRSASARRAKGMMPEAEEQRAVLAAARGHVAWGAPGMAQSQPAELSHGARKATAMIQHLSGADAAGGHGEDSDLLLVPSVDDHAWELLLRIASANKRDADGAAPGKDKLALLAAEGRHLLDACGYIKSPAGSSQGPSPSEAARPKGGFAKRMQAIGSAVSDFSAQLDKEVRDAEKAESARQHAAFKDEEEEQAGGCQIQ